MNTILDSKTTLPTGTWNVDATHSQVGFAVDYMGGTFRGTFSPLGASLTVAEDGTATIEGSAPVSGVHVQDENLAGHLQSPDFFDAERHPEISFRADELTLADGGTVAGSGELTIKGVTKPVELHGRLSSAPSVDPFGRERLGLTLETAIDRTEFGVAWNAPNQSGGNYLGDEVTLKADLTFVRQES